VRSLDYDHRRSMLIAGTSCNEIFEINITPGVANPVRSYSSMPWRRNLEYF